MAQSSLVAGETRLGGGGSSFDSCRKNVLTLALDSAMATLRLLPHMSPTVAHKYGPSPALTVCIVA